MMRSLLVLCVVFVSLLGRSSASAQDRAAILATAVGEVMGFIVGNRVHFGVCASADQANAATYRLAASEYSRIPEVNEAMTRAADIAANEAVRIGESPDLRTAHATLEAALAQTSDTVQHQFEMLANADPVAFTGRCRTFVQDFTLRRGPFQPLLANHPTAMLVITGFR